jgi:hypothetical protein
MRMDRLHRQMPEFLRVALLLLLLSMQSFSSAHEISQGEAHDSSLCVTCSIGSGHDAIAVSIAECPATTSNSSQSVFAATPAPSAALRHIPEARAPPVTL